MSHGPASPVTPSPPPEWRHTRRPPPPPPPLTNRTYPVLPPDSPRANFSFIRHRPIHQGVLARQLPTRCSLIMERAVSGAPARLLGSILLSSEQRRRGGGSVRGDGSGGGGARSSETQPPAGRPAARPPPSDTSLTVQRPPRPGHARWAGHKPAASRRNPTRIAAGHRGNSHAAATTP